MWFRKKSSNGGTNASIVEPTSPFLSAGNVTQISTTTAVAVAYQLGIASGPTGTVTGTTNAINNAGVGMVAFFLSPTATVTPFPAPTLTPTPTATPTDDGNTHSEPQLLPPPENATPSTTPPPSPAPLCVCITWPGNCVPRYRPA